MHIFSDLFYPTNVQQLNTPLPPSRPLWICQWINPLMNLEVYFFTPLYLNPVALVIKPSIQKHWRDLPNPNHNASFVGYKEDPRKAPLLLSILWENRGNHFQPRKHPPQTLNILRWTFNFESSASKTIDPKKANTYCMSFSVYSIFFLTAKQRKTFCIPFHVPYYYSHLHNASLKELVISLISKLIGSYNLSYIPKIKTVSNFRKIALLSFISNLDHAKSSHQNSSLGAIEISKNVWH